MAGEWPSVQFSQLCDITRGASPRPIHDWITADGIPWVKISDANAAQSRFITRTGECIRREGRHRSVEVHPGDLILSNSATPGIPKFMGVEACIHDGWLLLRNLRNLDKNFAYYLLLHERPRLVEQGNGSVFTNLRTDILKNHRVQLPPIATQRAIGTILGALDDKIELNRKMSETSESMARALFKSWFIDFDPVRAKVDGITRTSPAVAGLFPMSFQRSEAGDVPKGWTVVSIGDLADAEKGLSYKGGGLIAHGGMPMVNLGCFAGDGVFKAEAIKRYGGEFRERHLVSAGDLVVANTDMTQNRVVLGSPALVPVWDGEKKFLFTHHTFAIRFSRGQDVWRLFLYFALLQPGFREIAEGFATGTTVLALPKDGLLRLKIVLPDDGVRQGFERYVRGWLRRAEQARAESRMLATLRDTLLPKLISGELRVKDAERIAARTL